MTEENQNNTEDTVVFKTPGYESDNADTSNEESESHQGNENDTPISESDRESDLENGVESQSTEGERVVDNEESSARTEQPDQKEALSQYGFESMEELLASYDSLKQNEGKTQDAPVEEDEFVQRYKEFVSKGGDKSVFLKTMSVDYDKLSPKDVLKQKFLLDNAGSDPERLSKLFDLEFKGKYGYDEDLVDDDEKELKDLKLEMEKDSALKVLKEQQESTLKVPEQKAGVDTSEEDQKLVQQYAEMAGKTMEEYNSFDFAVDESPENKFVYTPEAEIKTKVADLLNNPYATPDDPERFMSSVVGKVFLDEKGDWDLNKATRLLTILADPEKYAKDLYDHGMKKGQELSITQKKNVHESHRDNGYSGGGNSEEDVVVFKNR